MWVTDGRGVPDGVTSGVASGEVSGDRVCDSGEVFVESKGEVSGEWSYFSLFFFLRVSCKAGKKQQVENT